MSQVVALLIINKLEITFVLLGFSPDELLCNKNSNEAQAFPNTHTHTYKKATRIHISASLRLIALTSHKFQSVSRKQGSFREYGNNILLNSALQKIKSHIRKIRGLKEFVGYITLLDL